MTRHAAAFAATLLLFASPALSQTRAALPHALATDITGGFAAGHGQTRSNVGGTFTFEVSDRIAVEARGLRINSGSGESGFQMTGTVLVSIARTARAEAYVAAGGGVARASFDMDDDRMLGAMNGPNGSMPMFYANRLSYMTVAPNGQRGMRTFTDPAMVLGGGLKLNLTERFYVTPDVRGVMALSGGHHSTSVTMNIGFGVRF